MRGETEMSGNVISVFYADRYHPIQAGSIDGTDVLPHDTAVLRAHLCSSAALYDPFGDPNAIGDPYATLFVGRLSHQTTQLTLQKAMSKYGRVRNLRLVTHIVTGASRGFAFVEFETEREMRRAYKDAHHSIIDDCEIIVDYNRQQLMPGWIPRRLGGGLGGKKESGQLRFGGRERPFRAPLRPIPYDELKKLGIPSPPEGRYMSRYQDPSPPRRDRTLVDREEEGSNRSRFVGTDEHHKISPDGSEVHSLYKISKERDKCTNWTSVERGIKSTSMEREGSSSNSVERSEHYRKRKSRSKESDSHKGGCEDETLSHRRHKSGQHDRSRGIGSDTQDKQ